MNRRRVQSRIGPYPEGDVTTTPPKGLFPFIQHFSRPVWPWLLVMSLLTALVSAAEVVFFRYMGGELVDWLGKIERANFWAEPGGWLMGVGAAVLVGLPLLVLVQSLVTHQSIFGNYPMIGRWLSHSHMLSQSLAFIRTSLLGVSRTAIIAFRPLTICRYPHASVNYLARVGAKPSHTFDQRPPLFPHKLSNSRNSPQPNPLKKRVPRCKIAQTKLPVF